jgi:hypothetical protein
MNSIIARIGAITASASIVLFMIFMPIFDFGSYLVCIFLALGYVMITAGFYEESAPERKTAAAVGLVFSGVYATIILLVYFAQLTSVRLDGLNIEALRILDYQRFGLLFNYDLLGYGMMALSTFFIGLSIKPQTKTDKWLKALLLVHGVFFISCLIAPMLGIFNQKPGANWIGILLLEIWCAYFLPVCVLTYLHFKKDRRVL